MITNYKLKHIIDYFNYLGEKTDHIYRKLLLLN